MCCRLGSGAFVSGKLAEFRKRPKEPIILYEFDGCPFCRKVGASSTLLHLLSCHFLSRHHAMRVFQTRSGLACAVIRDMPCSVTIWARFG